MSKRPIQFENFPESLSVGFGPFRAVIESVTDGDTLRAVVDVGWNSYHFTTIRLLGINAPELFHGDDAERTAGRASRDFMIDLLPPGTPVSLETKPDPDSFGRYLATISMTDGRIVNDLLVETGHAVYKTYT